MFRLFIALAICILANQAHAAQDNPRCYGWESEQQCRERIEDERREAYYRAAERALQNLEATP